MSIKCPVTTTVVFILIAGKQQYNLILYQESFNTNVIYQFFDYKITFVITNIHKFKGLFCTEELSLNVERLTNIKKTQI